MALHDRTPGSRFRILYKYVHRLKGEKRVMNVKTETYNVPFAVNYDDICTASQRLYGYAYRTPVLHSRSFNAEANMMTWFKCEQFQHSGAFKFRGAFNKIATLSPEERARGIITCSSGNHARVLLLLNSWRMYQNWICWRCQWVEAD
jgi:hypothetical protein